MAFLGNSNIAKANARRKELETHLESDVQSNKKDERKKLKDELRKELELEFKVKKGEGLRKPISITLLDSERDLLKKKAKACDMSFSAYVVSLLDSAGAFK
jgi:hypothetical protein